MSRKLTISSAPAKDIAASARSPHPTRRQFYCVNDKVPRETTDLLRVACDQRNVDYVELDAPLFDYDPVRTLEPGALLYRPAVSIAAQRVEQFLYSEGVATFYPQRSGPFFNCLNQTLIYERAGLPIPPTFYCSTANRTVLRRFVDQAGGFPMVLKMNGGERGIGVMRVDSFPALFSLVDYVLALGANPLLCAFIDNAVHWRVIVIGENAVAAYINSKQPDDFRTYAHDENSGGDLQVSSAMADIAVRAVQSSWYEFGGVDILEQPDGKLFLLEANFPCYFPQAQLFAGVDVAGMMVDYLLRKAGRLDSE